MLFCFPLCDISGYLLTLLAFGSGINPWVPVPLQLILSAIFIVLVSSLCGRAHGLPWSTTTFCFQAAFESGKKQQTETVIIFTGNAIC